MGVVSEILIQKPDNTFMPGDTVTGLIRYTLDEETTFSTIVISLKGMGDLSLRRQSGNRRRKYTKHETYVDVDYENLNEEMAIAAGTYEIPFLFTLPKNIPPSFDIKTKASSYKVTCTITYYVRIKFEKPEFFSFAKRFRKEITVLPTMTPNLPMEPTTHVEHGSLFTLCACVDSIVTLRANIKNSVIKPEGKIEIELEVNNDSHVNLSSIEIKLQQKYRFRAGPKASKSTDLRETKLCAIPRGVSETFVHEIRVPKDELSLEHSKIVERVYYVVATAVTPCPHCNVNLKIPIQIGEYTERNVDGLGRPSAPPAEELQNTDDPPSYWEAMGEDHKD